MLRLSTFLFLLVSIPTFVLAQTRNNSYIAGLYSNDFVDPDWFLSRNFSQSTLGAQQTIVRWADQLNTQGPWSELLLMSMFSQGLDALFFQVLQINQLQLPPATNMTI